MTEGAEHSSGPSNWTQILRLLDPGERLIGLMLLVALAMIGVAAATDAPGWIIAAGAMIAILVLVVAVAVNLTLRSRNLNRVHEKVSETSHRRDRDGVAAVDTYFAAPMAAVEDFSRSKDTGPRLLMILEALREKANAGEIYYGGKLIEHEENFDPPPVGYLLAMQSLNEAKRFVLIWPEKLPTSALFELGVARARNLPTVIFYKKESDLPYLLQGRLDLAEADDWPTTFIKFESVRDVIDQVSLRGEGLFPRPA